MVNIMNQKNNQNLTYYYSVYHRINIKQYHRLKEQCVGFLFTMIISDHFLFSYFFFMFSQSYISLFLHFSFFLYLFLSILFFVWYVFYFLLLLFYLQTFFTGCIQETGEGTSSFLSFLHTFGMNINSAESHIGYTYKEQERGCTALTHM